MEQPRLVSIPHHWRKQLTDSTGLSNQLEKSEVYNCGKRMYFSYTCSHWGAGGVVSLQDGPSWSLPPAIHTPAETS